MLPSRSAQTARRMVCLRLVLNRAVPNGKLVEILRRREALLGIDEKKSQFKGSYVITRWMDEIHALVEIIMDRRAAQALADAVAEARDTNDPEAYELVRQLLDRRLGLARQVRDRIDVLFPSGDLGHWQMLLKALKEQKKKLARRTPRRRKTAPAELA